MADDSSNSVHVTVVIPARNEERNIVEVLERCKPYADEILVVDGHSTDRMREICEELGARVVLDNGKGKGDGIRVAAQESSGEITVFIDADGSHDPDDIPKLVELIDRDEADHVSASRLMGGSSELHGGFDEFFRLMGSSFITACINKRFGVKLSESQNGFRALRTEVLRALNLTENITTIEQEMIMKTLHRGYRMGEVPSHEYERKHGTSSIRVSRVAFRYVYTLFKYLIFK